MYYRLYDNQVGRYMATGYNTKSLQELAEEYAEYKSNDWDGDYDEGEETQTQVWSRMTLENKIDFIKDDEFEIEESITPFDEAETQ